MKLLPLPAFSDNYIWLLHDGTDALVVDPGDAAPVMKALQQYDLRLRKILVTHHHADHVGGLNALRQAYPAVVYGPAQEAIDGIDVPLHEGDTVDFLSCSFDVLEVPGHTAGHIAFYAASTAALSDESPLLFCGDTLFSGGCGRLFEGTPAQMAAALQRFAALPDSTRVCCTHEYTLANLRFALQADAHNTALQNYFQRCQALRNQNLPTLPSTIGQERDINPFMRTHLPAVAAAVEAYDPLYFQAHGVFAALRHWKNLFQ